MATYLDLDRWERREHFELFRGYADPFWNVCVEVEVTALLDLLREHREVSPFLAYYFLALDAANRTEPFRYRLRGDRVLIHECIHGGSTLMLDDGRFTFAYLDYEPDFGRFHAAARAEIDQRRAGDGRLEPRDDRDDLIHTSVLPWIAFTSFAHARSGAAGDSIPKLVFGKFTERAGKTVMPLSIEVHHALMDGLHVGRFLARFEKRLADPAVHLGI